ncbi:MAG TPA: glucose 1-dehydrogenase [Chitinophagaceae bacterium]|nr:glucose 1-dehydrogenase [Chitinophagaceae bacterium]
MKKILLITGGSRGIGAATALKASRNGYKVCINYVNNELAATKIVELIKTEGGVATAIRGDVSSEADVIRMFEHVDRVYGKVDALVNNAGILNRRAMVTDMSADAINRLLQINITGSLLCAREAIKRMKDKGGAIVNVSSAAAKHGSPFEYVDYAASKGAIDTMTIGLAKEVACDNIRVNAVRPGIILTDIHESGGDPDRVERLKDVIPLKRAGDAEEVANAILWLLSDQATYVTGSILDVSGGR